MTDKHTAQLTDLNNVIAALRNEVDGFRSQTERLTTEITTERAALQETQMRIQEEKITSTRLFQRVQDMEAQLSKEETHRLSLEEKHRHAREALDHFRVAAKEQRDQDQRQFEQQIQFLQRELRSAKDALNTKQQELIGIHEDNARLSNEVENARNGAHRLEAEIRILRTTKEQLGIVETTNQHLTQRLGDAEQQREALRRENQVNTERLQAALVASQKIEAELAAARAIVAMQQEQLLQQRSLSVEQGNKTRNAGVQEVLFDQPQ